MVCFHREASLPLSPLIVARDWSKTWDGQQPPLKGQLAFCTMLVGVSKRSHWQPRTADSMPPVAFRLGCGLFCWTHSREAAERDVRQFNANQLQKLDKRGVRLWAATGWGVCGFPETVRVLERRQA